MSGTPNVRHDEDFALWCEQQAAALTEHRWELLDVAHVADEITSLARADQREVKHRLTTLLEVLMKIVGDPDAADRTALEATVDEQARALRSLLDESPSLQHTVREYFAAAHERAAKRLVAAIDTPARTMPSAYWQERVDDLIAHA